MDVPLLSSRRVVLGWYPPFRLFAIHYFAGFFCVVAGNAVGNLFNSSSKCFIFYQLLIVYFRNFLSPSFYLLSVCFLFCPPLPGNHHQTNNFPGVRIHIQPLFPLLFWNRVLGHTRCHQWASSSNFVLYFSAVESLLSFPTSNFRNGLFLFLASTWSHVENAGWESGLPG